MPAEALETYLCEKYHCPPDVLDRQDPVRVLTHLTVWAVEADVAAARARNRGR